MMRSLLITLIFLGLGSGLWAQTGSIMGEPVERIAYANTASVNGEAVSAGGGGGATPVAEWTHTSGVYSDAGATLLSGSGDNGIPVQEWHDTITGRVLSQTSGASQPLYDDVNGIQFQGTDDFMTLGSGLVTSQPYTVFVKFRALNTTSTGCVLNFVNTGSTSEYFAFFAEGAYAGDPLTLSARSSSAGENYSRTSTGYSSATDHVLAAAADGTSDRAVYIDGGASGSNTTTVTPSGINDMAVGMLRDSSPGAAFVGHIQTILVYDSALSPSEITTISASL